MALLTDLVNIHRLHAESVPNAAIPVFRDAASAFTVCSSVISTAAREKFLLVRLIDSAPFSRICFTPGWVLSMLMAIFLSLGSLIPQSIRTGSMVAGA